MDQLDHGVLDHPHFLVMINKASKGFFPSSRGIRQGDPLFPFLFTLVANGFSALMSKVVDNGFIKGFNASENGPLVFHLQFVDDIIFFVEASCMEQVLTLK